MPAGLRHHHPRDQPIGMGDGRRDDRRHLGGLREGGDIGLDLGLDGGPAAGDDLGGASGAAAGLDQDAIGDMGRILPQIGEPCIIDDGIAPRPQGHLPSLIGGRFGVDRIAGRPGIPQPQDMRQAGGLVRHMQRDPAALGVAATHQIGQGGILRVHDAVVQVKEIGHRFSSPQRVGGRVGRRHAQQARGKAFGGIGVIVGTEPRRGVQDVAGHRPEVGLGQGAVAVQQVRQIGQHMRHEAIHHQIAQIGGGAHAVIGAVGGLGHRRLDFGKVGDQVGTGQQMRNIFQAFAEIAGDEARGPAAVLPDQHVLAMRLQRDAVMGHQVPEGAQNGQQLRDPGPRPVPFQPGRDDRASVGVAQRQHRQRYGILGRRAAADGGKPSADQVAPHDGRAMFGQDGQTRQRRVAFRHPHQPPRDRGRDADRPRHQIADRGCHPDSKRQLQVVAAVPVGQRAQ